MNENNSYKEDIGNEKNLQETDLSNKPLIAGVLLLIAGLLGIINYSIYAMASSITVNSIITNLSSFGMEITRAQAEQFLLICGAIGIIISIFPILASLFCFKRKLWGFALGASIIGIFSIGPLFISSVLSLIAVILIEK